MTTTPPADSPGSALEDPAPLVRDADAPTDADALLPDYARNGPSVTERVRAWWADRGNERVPRDVPSSWQGRAEWIVPLVVVAIAALLRFIGLGHPHALVFDETYYVKDAWSLAHLGYEGSWPDKANESFQVGDTMIFTDEGSRVVHPPLGKWLIAVGMLIFGGADSFGWRFTTALLGTLTVAVTYLIGRRLTRSVWWAGLAALFVAIDGLGIVLSRVSLLDGILTFFVLLGSLFILLDHRHAMARIARSTDDFIGPVMWNRPWVITAGLAFGAAGAVKWSGFYALAGFGLYLVASDAFARRRAGVKMWGSAAIGRQGPASFVLLVGPALAVYLASWTGWLVTAGGYMRDSSSNALIALWKYHEDSASFHVGLATPHSYASPAWQWPFLVRPTSMYWTDATCGSGSGEYRCVEAITSIPNPLLWWVGIIATIAITYGLVRFRDWRLAIVLVGFATSYLPWLLVPNRTIFQFYTVLMVPFMMLAIVLVLQRVTTPGDPERAREVHVWKIVTNVFVALAVIVSLYFLPVWTAMQIPYDFWLSHMWLKTWV